MGKPRRRSRVSRNQRPLFSACALTRATGQKPRERQSRICCARAVRGGALHTPCTDRCGSSSSVEAASATTVYAGGQATPGNTACRCAGQGGSSGVASGMATNSGGPLTGRRAGEYPWTPSLEQSSCPQDDSSTWECAKPPRSRSLDEASSTGRFYNIVTELPVTIGSAQCWQGWCMGGRTAISLQGDFTALSQGEQTCRPHRHLSPRRTSALMPHVDAPFQKRAHSVSTAVRIVRMPRIWLSYIATAGTPVADRQQPGPVQCSCATTNPRRSPWIAN